MTKVTRLTIEEGGGLNRRRIHLREISGDLDSPLETVGQDLRAARLRRGDDLATVSRALKIRKDHLEALEEDRLESLPGRAYAVGFLRTYADYLGLDAMHCVERFKAEIAGRSEETTPPVTVIDEDEHRRLPQGWKIIAGVVLILFVYGAYHLLVPAADRMLAPPVDAVPSGIAPKPALVQAVRRSQPAPQTVPPAQTAPDTTAIGTATPPAGSTTMPTTTPSTTTGIPAPTTSTPPANTSAPASTNGLLPSGADQAYTGPVKVYGGLNRNVRVVLRAREAAKILVTGPDGTVFLNHTLNPGDTYMVPNHVGMTLMTTNAGAIEIDLDGTSMGLAGRQQQITEGLSLDPQAIVDRYNGGRG